MEKSFSERHTDQNQLTIRKANQSDAAAIGWLVLLNARKTLFQFYSPLQWEVFSRYYSTEAVLAKLDTQVIFCGEISNQLVATVAIENGFVLGFYTHPDHLGKGLGTRMMEYLELEAKAQGILQLELAASPVGVAYYLKHGWDKVDDEDFYYEGVLFRETRMRKKL